MKTKKLHKKVVSLSRPYRVTTGDGFSLRQFPTDDSGKLEDGAETDELLAGGVQLMSDLQERLYADDKWSVLLVFQAMDAAGKDGTIKHVMSGINPAGCQVTSFKQPSQLELDHDFLWRASLALPQRGRIGIFNRSYYEETLVGPRPSPGADGGEDSREAHAASTSGRNDSRTSAPSSATWYAAARSSSSSSFIFPRASRRSAFSPGWMSRRKIGSFPHPT